MKDRVVIGSRSSNLALIQSRYVAERLETAHPGLVVAIETFSTKGDRELDKPLAEIGGKGLFTAELEQGLRSGEIDLAVHSLKDLPTDDPQGLAIGAVPERATPFDALVSEEWSSLENLPDGSRIGTSSPRRKAQLLAINPTWLIEDIRGNVETRINKVSGKIVDAAILACAGLERIGRSDAIAQVLTEDLMMPACGQGALAVQCTDDNRDLLELLEAIHHEPTGAATRAERAFLAGLGGGCQVPIGALAKITGNKLNLQGCVCREDGSDILRVTVTGEAGAAENLGRAAAEEALEKGAADIVSEVS